MPAKPMIKSERWRQVTLTAVLLATLAASLVAAQAYVQAYSQPLVPQMSDRRYEVGGVSLSLPETWRLQAGAVPQQTLPPNARFVDTATEGRFLDVSAVRTQIANGGATMRKVTQMLVGDEPYEEFERSTNRTGDVIVLQRYVVSGAPGGGLTHHHIALLTADGYRFRVLHLRREVEPASDEDVRFLALRDLATMQAVLETVELTVPKTSETEPTVPETE